MSDPTWLDVFRLVQELRAENSAYYSEVREALNGIREWRDGFVKEIEAALTLHMSQVSARIEHTNRNADEALTRLESHLGGHKKIDEEAARGRTAIRVQLITTIGAIIVAVIAVLSK